MLTKKFADLARVLKVNVKGFVYTNNFYVTISNYLLVYMRKIEFFVTNTFAEKLAC